MTIRTDENPFVIFDLDDTLSPEIDYLKSAYQEIALFILQNTKSQIYDEMLQRHFRKENVFYWILNKYKEQLSGYSLDFFLSIYRNHMPQLTLNSETAQVLEKMANRQIKMGLISDGRSITQRNKLKALGIEKYFSDIIISEEFGSEKPDTRNYLYFEKKYPGHSFYYVGDNTLKDFIVPKQLGWKMICLKDCGNNVHKQCFDDLMEDLILISSFREIHIS
jgi:putative hydrolase of the HAD superfamily